MTEADVAQAAQAAILCLALNAYHEARGEGVAGMLAVSTTVMARVESGNRRWPREVCAVVRQGGERRGKCQFRWYCDGKSDRARDRIAWEQAMIVANAAMNGARDQELVEATCYYAAGTTKPSWARKSRFVAKRGRHLFYVC